MTQEDFDIDSLAAFLHLQPAQVSRLADRDKLPGRKVGGRWRFSSAEIHHWLEKRIGLSDEDELAQMENLLQKSSPGTDQCLSPINDLLAVDAIAVPLKARTRDSVISQMSQLAAQTGLLWDANKMAEAIRAREAMHPTALDVGVALMHPRRPMRSIVGEAFLALGVTPTGIPFGGLHGGLTDIFFLICSIDDQGHLQTLARLSRLIGNGSLLRELRQVTSAEAAHRLITDCDARLNTENSV